MIVIVAPYSPVGLSKTPNLGAARKIEVIVAALAALKLPIVLVNSAHNDEVRAGLQQRQTVIGGVPLTEVMLPTLKRRPLGKAVNLLQVSAVVGRVLDLGVPSLIWLYNGYAFECLFAQRMRHHLDVPVVLEFEDWHFSRGVGVKTLLDYLAWRTCARHFALAFCVNANLQKRMERLGVASRLLPGVVPDELISLSASRPFTKDVLTVGYFGGLTREKGAHLLLELASCLPQEVQLVVSGAGPLADDFRRLADTPGEAVCFLGQVGVEQLYAAIAKCDLIVNPHMSIKAMEGGVFPFKVIEAIASGRLLISTALPMAGIEHSLRGVLFFDGSAVDLKRAIEAAHAFFCENSHVISDSALRAATEFSSASVVLALDDLLGSRAEKQREIGG